jgi:hypothetical protein
MAAENPTDFPRKVSQGPNRALALDHFAEWRTRSVDEPQVFLQILVSNGTAAF